MFKRGLQQTPCLVCHDKGGSPATSWWPAGQALKISSMGFPQRLPLKHLSCVSSVYHQQAESNSLNSALLQSAPEPRVQILVLTFASHMGGTGSFTPSPAPHSLLKVPVTLSLWGEAKAKDPQWKAWNDKLFRSLGGKWNNPRLMFNSCTLCRRIYWLLLCWTSRCRAKKFITCSPRSWSVMNIWEFPIRSRGGSPPVDSQPHQLLRVWD